MKSFVKLLIFLFSLNLHCQREADNWYFGEKAGLNFNNNTPIVLNDSEMIAPSGCTSISDVQGNLLFYTNGNTVWNNNHQIMENGENLNGDINFPQSTIIIPKPNDPTTYYIITNKTTTSTNLTSPGVYYSVVKINNQSPLGKIELKNTRLRPTKTERIAAVHHVDGSSIWLITFGKQNSNDESLNNTFISYKIDSNGIGIFTTSVRKELDDIPEGDGFMKISPDGKKIVTTVNSDVNVYNFSPRTGDVTSDFSAFLGINLESGYVPKGIAFSSDSKVLYLSSTYHAPGIKAFVLLQHNISVPFDGIGNPTLGEQIFFSQNFSPGALQEASNGKIYAALYENSEEGELIPSNKIGVINKPSVLGVEADYQHESLDVLPGKSMRGLPTFVQSYFRNRIIGEDKCVSEIFEFSLDSYSIITSAVWDFGDGTTATGLNPSHNYTTPGVYTVKAEISFNNITMPIYKEIEVFGLPELTPNQRLTQCDVNNDGTDFFDLNDIKNFITNPSLGEQLLFYKTLVDAESDTNRIPNPESFQNESNPQELFVRAISLQGCSSITNFFIESRYLQFPDIPEMFSCEDSDNIINNNEAEFNLRGRKSELIQILNLSPDSQIRFYPTLVDAQTTNNEIPDAFNTSSTVIFARIDNQTGCGGIKPMNLVVNSSIQIDLEDNYVICSNPNINPSIILDGLISNDRFEWKDENGNLLSNNREFTVSQAGNYSLTVYKDENGLECSRTKDFSVINTEPPVFESVVVNTEGNTSSITVTVTGNSTYQFSLDNQNFQGNSLSYTFTNVEAGVKTIYVKDINDCQQIIQTNVSIINYLAFMTPNGDGKFDRWKILGVTEEFFKSADITIFNRFGRAIHKLDLTTNQRGWNAIYEGKEAPPNNYWFKATLIDNEGNIIKKTGSFSLIR